MHHNDQTHEIAAINPTSQAKKLYARPSVVGIGKTKDLVQSYYPYNYSEDGYSRYYVYKY